MKKSKDWRVRVEPTSMQWNACLLASAIAALQQAPQLENATFRTNPDVHTLLSGSRKRGVEFKGGSRHDRNRRDRRNRQNRHGCLLALYFVGEAKKGKVLSRTAKIVKTTKTVMKATPLKLNPPFPWSWYKMGKFSLSSVSLPVLPFLAFSEDSFCHRQVFNYTYCMTHPYSCMFIS